MVDVRRYIVIGGIAVLLAYNFFSLSFVFLLFVVVIVVVFFIRYKNEQARDRRRLLLLGLSLRPNLQHERSKIARLSAIARDHRRINSEQNSDQGIVCRRNYSTNNFSSNETRGIFCSERLLQMGMSPRHNNSFLESGYSRRSELKRDGATSSSYDDNTKCEESISHTKEDAFDLQRHNRTQGIVGSPSCINRLARLETTPSRRVLASVRRYPSHQPQYSFLGSYPTVHLKSPEMPVLNTSRSSFGISPVTIKIAPLETLQSNPRWSFIYSPPSSPTKASLDPCDTKTVVAALRESRKRGRNVKQDLTEENGAKRLRRDTASSSSSTIPSKFGSSTGMASTSLSPLPDEGIVLAGENGKRSATPLELSLHMAFKKLKNNAVSSSYSSSQRKSPLPQMEEVASATKRRAESNQSASPLSKAFKRQNSSSYDVRWSESENDNHQSQDNLQDVTEHVLTESEEARVPGEVSSQADPSLKGSSTKSPFVKDGSATNKRPFSLYASLENTSKKDYCIPNHLTTLEEFKEDRKLEEERLQHLLKGVMGGFDDGPSKTLESPSNSQAPTLVDGGKLALPLTMTTPLATSLTVLTSSAKPETVANEKSLLPSSIFQTPASAALVVAIAPIATPSTTSLSLPSLVPKTFENPIMPASVGESSKFGAPPPPYSTAVTTLTSDVPPQTVALQVEQTPNRESVTTSVSFATDGHPSGTPQASVGSSLANPWSTSAQSFWPQSSSLPVTTVAVLSHSQGTAKSPALPVFGSGSATAFNKASTTETTFSCTSPISSTTAKPTTLSNNFHISELPSTPAVNPFSFRTTNAATAAQPSLGQNFFSTANSQPKMGSGSMQFGMTSVPSSTGPRLHVVEKPLVTSSGQGTGPNLFGFSSAPTSQSISKTHTLSFAVPEAQQNIASKSSPFGNVTFSSPSVAPLQFGTPVTSNTPLFGSALATPRSNVSQSVPTFGTVASTGQSTIQPSFFASPSPSAGFGNSMTSTTPNQTPNIFGGTNSNTVSSLRPNMTTGTFLTTPQTTSVFGTASAINKPTFGSTTPNLVGGFGSGKTSFGANATSEASLNVFGSLGQNHSVFPTPAISTGTTSNIFGSVGQNQSVFSTPAVATETTSNIFGSVGQNQSVFSTPAVATETSSNIFGSIGQNQPVFSTPGNATKTSSSIFGNVGQNQPALANSNVEFGSVSFRPSFSSNSAVSPSSSASFQLTNPMMPSFNNASSVPNFNFGGSTTSTFTFGSTPQMSDNPSVASVQPQPFVFTAGVGNFGGPPANTGNLFSIGSGSIQKRPTINRRKGRK